MAKVIIDNSPRGQLISLLGAFALDSAKPWVDQAISEALTQDRKEIATALLTALEGGKHLYAHTHNPNNCRVCNHNETLDKAKAIVTNLLTPTV